MHNECHLKVLNGWIVEKKIHLLKVLEIPYLVDVKLICSIYEKSSTYKLSFVRICDGGSSNLHTFGQDRRR